MKKFPEEKKKSWKENFRERAPIVFPSILGTHAINAAAYFPVKKYINSMKGSSQSSQDIGGHKVHFNVADVPHFSPESGEIHAFSRDPKNIRSAEQGIMAHEIGHAKNISNLPKFIKKVYPFYRSQMFRTAPLAATAGVVTSKNKKQAKRVALLSTIPAGLIFGEEALASARGIKHLAKTRGWKKALRSAPGSVMGLPTYGSLAFAPSLISYQLKKRQLAKQGITE